MVCGNNSLIDNYTNSPSDLKTHFVYIPAVAPSTVLRNTQIQNYKISPCGSDRDIIVDITIHKLNEWYSLGLFYCKSGENKILLGDNEGRDQVIVA